MGFTIARVVAGGMLVGALGQQPYDYYTILRWGVCAVSVYGALLAHDRRAPAWVWIYGVVGVVFNPIVPVYLSRPTWAPINLAAAIAMFVSVVVFRSRGSVRRRTRV